STLPAGVVDEAYSQTLAATGGTGAYTWSVTAGALPNGLTLDPVTGEINGTPTETGTFTFTVQVTDAAGATAEREFTLVVVEELVVTTAALAEWTVDTAGYSQTL